MPLLQRGSEGIFDLGLRIADCGLKNQTTKRTPITEKYFMTDS
jgi:hypothetical protein